MSEAKLFGDMQVRGITSASGPIKRPGGADKILMLPILTNVDGSRKSGGEGESRLVRIQLARL
jgi:hypothetical protein